MEEVKKAVEVRPREPVVALPLLADVTRVSRSSLLCLLNPPPIYSLPQVAELEQAATLRAQKTAEAANDSQTPETAAVAAPSTSSSVPTVLSFLRLNSVVFPASNGGFAPSQDTPEVVKQLSGQEGAAIGKIAYALLGAGGEEVAQKLVAGGEEEVLEGVTCE